jgi:hypothetical protein
VSLWPSGTHYSCRLQCSSDTGAIDSTSGLHNVRSRGTVIYDNRNYQHVCRIRYETAPALHTRDIYSNRPADLLAFSVIVYLVIQSNANKIPIFGLFRTVVQDATFYFLVIFSSHVVLVMFIIFARVRIPS